MLLVASDFVGQYRLDSNPLLAVDYQAAIDREERTLLGSLFFLESVQRILSNVGGPPALFLRDEASGFMAFAIPFIFYRIRLMLNSAVPSSPSTQGHAVVSTDMRLQAALINFVNTVRPYAPQVFSASLTTPGSFFPFPSAIPFAALLHPVGGLVEVRSASTPPTIDTIAGVTQSGITLVNTYAAGQYTLTIRTLELKQKPFPVCF